MKGIIRNLVVSALFLVPAYGQIIQLQFQDDQGSEGGNRAAYEIQAPTTSNMDASEADLDFPVFRAIGGLGLVLCLIVGGYFGVKKFAPRYFAKHTSDKSLKVIETLAMGDRRSISLIQVANSRFLVGNTPQQISFLAALPKPIPLDSDPAVSPANTTGARLTESRSSFRNLFEVEKNRGSRAPLNPLSDDVRVKMRQLREALEQ